MLYVNSKWFKAYNTEFRGNLFMNSVRTNLHYLFDPVSNMYIMICRGRFYYWNTETEQVSWLSPHHPRAHVSFSAEKLKGNHIIQTYCKDHLFRKITLVPMSASLQKNSKVITLLKPTAKTTSLERSPARKNQCEFPPKKIPFIFTCLGSHTTLKILNIKLSSSRSGKKPAICSKA